MPALCSDLKTALVERSDFSSGTSSRSTKLIHGGVRYLQKAIMKLDYEQVVFLLRSDTFFLSYSTSPLPPPFFYSLHSLSSSFSSNTPPLPLPPLTFLSPLPHSHPSFPPPPPSTPLNSLSFFSSPVDSSCSSSCCSRPPVSPQYMMVKEALHERANLLEIAPHLSAPLPIMLPVYK